MKFLEMTDGIIARKNLKITFLTDAPFMVKFRFEKYRYLLTHLLCLQIFFSHKTIQMVPKMFLLLLAVIVLCLSCLMILSFCPKIYAESETDQILNAKYFV